MGTTWVADGYHIGTICVPHGYHVIPHGYHMGTTQVPAVFGRDACCLLCGRGGAAEEPRNAGRVEETRCFEPSCFVVQEVGVLQFSDRVISPNYKSGGDLGEP